MKNVASQDREHKPMSDTIWKYAHIPVWDNLKDRGIAVSVPIADSDEIVPRLITDYWAISDVDSVEWFVRWTYNVRDLVAEYRVTEDAIRILSHQFPQARVDGLVCPRCQKQHYFTSRSQFGLLLKSIRDGELPVCDNCRLGIRQEARAAAKATKTAFAKSHPWTFSAVQLKEIRVFAPQWRVAETLALRKSMCRECGKSIAKGEPRLTFSLASPQNQNRQGHIHIAPCGSGAAKGAA
jgi:hypothetical protein